MEHIMPGVDTQNMVVAHGMVVVHMKNYFSILKEVL